MNYKLNNKENFSWFVSGITDGDVGLFFCLRTLRTLRSEKE